MNTKDIKDTLWAYRRLIVGTFLISIITIVLPSMSMFIYWYQGIWPWPAWLNLTSVVFGFGIIALRYRMRWAYFSPNYSMVVATPIDDEHVELLARHGAVIETAIVERDGIQEDRALRILHARRDEHVESKLMSTPVFGDVREMVSDIQASPIGRLKRFFVRIGFIYPAGLNRFPAHMLLKSKKKLANG